ncbi:MAG: TraB/GumN family protein, partial [Halodesulfurarchaeum sp.]
MSEEPAPIEEEKRGSVHVIGTAHVSAESVEEVERIIEEKQPDVVAVELDEARYRQMKGETPDDIDPKDLLKGSVAVQFLAYWFLSYIQKRLGDRFDVEPGADMRAGVDTAERIGADVALVDRDIQVTIQRFWARMRLREKVRVLWELTLAIAGFGGDADEEIDLENLTDADVVTAMMEEFRRFSPGGANALIDERDAYLAHNLIGLREAGADVVAVIGAGHQRGVLKYLEHPESLPPMDTLTGREKRRFSLAKAAGYLLAIGFLVFFVLLAMAGVGNLILLKVFAAWFLFNGIFAFVLAKIGGAHWTSATVGGLVAWMTSLNPLLAPGWFAGYVELRYAAVNLSDVGTLNEILSDEESPIRDLLERMLDVPLFRLITVVALTNVGSMIASLLFPVVVLPLLGGPFDSVGAVTAAMRSGAANSAELIWRTVA